MYITTDRISYSEILGRRVTDLTPRILPLTDDFSVAVSGETATTEGIHEILIQAEYEVTEESGIDQGQPGSLPVCLRQRTIQRMGFTGRLVQ